MLKNRDSYPLKRIGKSVAGFGLTGILAACGASYNVSPSNEKYLAQTDATSLQIGRKIVQKIVDMKGFEIGNNSFGLFPRSASDTTAIVSYFGKPSPLRRHFSLLPPQPAFITVNATSMPEGMKGGVYNRVDITYNVDAGMARTLTAKINDRQLQASDLLEALSGHASADLTSVVPNADTSMESAQPTADGLMYSNTSTAPNALVKVTATNEEKTIVPFLRNLNDISGQFHYAAK